MVLVFVVFCGSEEIGNENKERCLGANITTYFRICVDILIASKRFKEYSPLAG